MKAAESLKTSVPSVAGMIQRMRKQGLVGLDTDKRIQLTKRAVELGANMARRNRLGKWLVVQMDLPQLVPPHGIRCLGRRSIQVRILPGSPPRAGGQHAP